MDAIQMAKDWLKTNDPYEPEDGYQAREIIEGLINPWQLIETAPKDETRFIAYSPNWTVHKIYVIYWDALGGCFVDDEGIDVMTTPTHWMPLPEPPQSCPTIPR